MNRFGIFALALGFGILIGYFAPTLIGESMTPSQRCLDNASKRPTDLGVRLAMSVCDDLYKK